MKGVAFFFLAALCVCSAFPNLPQTFTAKLNVESHSHTGKGNDTGTGVWAVDKKGQSSIESYVYNKGVFDAFSLNRYDLGKLFRIYGTNSSRCDTVPVNDPMPDVWAWVQESHYDGQEHFQDKSVDVWSANLGYGTRKIAVLSTNASVPVWIDFKGGQRDYFMEFTSFSASAPDSALFTVPSTCEKSNKKVAATADCISSKDVMTRAEVWVAHKVPYNQGATYMGYRTDCSGYVSYCWDSSKPGHDTSDMHDIAHPISKEELVPGDCMLYAADHVCLFGGWIDKDKTHYWAYEETQPCSVNPNWCGTRKDDVTYPYYYDPSDFLPYRYDNFCGK